MRIFFYVEVTNDANDERSPACIALDALSELLEKMHDDLHDGDGLQDRGRASFPEVGAAISWAVVEGEQADPLANVRTAAKNNPRLAAVLGKLGKHQ
jgi:hypothetical protein